jgi:cell wall-associated NlpC family hydrolase
VTDRRGRFATDLVGAETVRGELDAPAYVEPWVVGIAATSTFLHAAPGGPRDRELLFGDRVDVIEDRGGWSFGRAAKGGYCGWLESHELGPYIAATHAVRTRHTHVYPEPDMKRPPSLCLPFAARLRVDGIEGRWAVTPSGWVDAGHLQPLDAPFADPVAVAELFLGAPYLWAGNTGTGIDCSGLVQVACLACGIGCPGDSDQQEAALGAPLGDLEPLRRGDLLFWPGHVAWVATSDTILHANAHAMLVCHEPLDAALARIEAQGDGAVRARRRLRNGDAPERGT